MAYNTTPIDIAWLKSINVNGTDEELQAYAERVNNELTFRLGDIMTEKMTERQVEEFTTLAPDSENPEALLASMIPGYDEISLEQDKIIRDEISSSSDPVALITSWQLSNMAIDN